MLPPMTTLPFLAKTAASLSADPIGEDAKDSAATATEPIGSSDLAPPPARTTTPSALGTGIPDQQGELPAPQRSPVQEAQLAASPVGPASTEAPSTRTSEGQHLPPLTSSMPASPPDGALPPRPRPQPRMVPKRVVNSEPVGATSATSEDPRPSLSAHTASSPTHLTPPHEIQEIVTPMPALDVSDFPNHCRAAYNILTEVVDWGLSWDQSVRAAVNLQRTEGYPVGIFPPQTMSHN